jgi:hypothetical protein
MMTDTMTCCLSHEQLHVYWYLLSVGSSGGCMTQYDSDMALVQVLGVLGFLSWSNVTMYL